MPRVRIGHGLYTPELDSEEGKKLIKEIKKSNAVMEFQLTSNVRLNNLSKIEGHPLKKYLDNGVKCVQGTDGCGFYGTDTIEEQLAMQNLLELKSEDFEKMRDVEDEIINENQKYFIKKSKDFDKFLNGRTLRKAILQLEDEIINEDINKNIKLRLNNKVDSSKKLKDIIKELPTDKTPIIVAGGSFNAQNIETITEDTGINSLRELIKKLDDKKVFFVIGHKLQGYEKAVLELCEELNKKIEIYAIIPKMIEKNMADNILKSNITGVRISTESEDFGIYKSFNYEIFERRFSIVIAFDGHSPVSNLVQEAKNGKAKSKIYVNRKNENLNYKAKTLKGYITPFEIEDNIANKIIEDNIDIIKK